MNRRVVILAGLLWLLAFVATAASGADRFLVVRYDDYAPTSVYTRASESAAPDVAPRPVETAPDLEARLFDLFQRHHARIVVGVIPFPIRTPADPPKPPDVTPLTASWLADADDRWVILLRQYVATGTVEPALHGYEHRRNTRPGHRPGEFAGQPDNWQLDAIRRGRDALSLAIEGTVPVFVPPWNSWDANTARALDSLGFAWCSPDAHHADYDDGRVRFVPQTASEPSQVLAFLRSGQTVPPGSILVLTTHPFDFTGPDGDRYFQSLEQLLQQVQSDPNWACVGLGDLPPATLAEWHLRFRRAVAWNNTADLAQDMVCLAPLAARPAPLYESVNAYVNRTLSWRLVIAIALLVAVALGWLAGCLAARWGRRRWARTAALLPALAALILLAGALSIVARGYHVRGIRWQVVCVAAGLSLGLAIYPPRRTAAGGPRT
jgi:peptidoglycan/xylan/chitin deacetylase (PgdA/CDA1 family)